MKTSSQKHSPYRQRKVARHFLDKHDDALHAVLHCFDRVIFKGYLPFGGDDYLNAFVDRLGLLRKDFFSQLAQYSDRLVANAQAMAGQADAPYQYLRQPHKKEKLIDQIDDQRKHPDGLVAVLCCLEACRSVKLRKGDGRPQLSFERRQQRVLYFYFNDPDFGRVHVRQETWFPFTIQVYVNGHEWLARQMLREGLEFTQVDNCFTQLSDPVRAQKLADRFRHVPWGRRLATWARLVNPLLRECPWLRDLAYRWFLSQVEYSTDVIFRQREGLAELFPRLLDHAAVTFSAEDILTFLGRKLHGRFQGEVVTTCHKGRHPGARIKHRMKGNWLKMYDKGGGLVLRVETVINEPREFRVRRARFRNGQRVVLWCPMNKGIVNLYHYQVVAHSANQRYLDALSVVDDPSASYAQVQRLSEPCVVAGRSHAGFNPARSSDIRLFAAVLHGDHLVHGFRNGDVRQRYVRNLRSLRSEKAKFH